MSNQFKLGLGIETTPWVPMNKQFQSTAELKCEESLCFICIPMVDEQAGSGVVVIMMYQVG